MASFKLLEQSEEDALHAERLLSFESKLYKQLARRILNPDAPVAVNGAAFKTSSSAENAAEDRQKKIAKWRNDTLLEFAAFESNLARVQFLLRSNDLERQRYAAEKQRIIDTSQSVREGNAQLHSQLADAKAALEVRKGYDALAADITDRKSPLKSREETQTAIEKLQSDITQLEREFAEYADTWDERREQFGKIVDEGTNMLRLIRDEKEEAERHDDGTEGEDEGSSPHAAAAAASRGESPKPGEDGPAGKSEPSAGQSSLRMATGVDDDSPPNGDGVQTEATKASEEHRDGMQIDTTEHASDALEEGEAQDSPMLAEDKMEVG